MPKIPLDQKLMMESSRQSGYKKPEMKSRLSISETESALTQAYISTNARLRVARDALVDTREIEAELNLIKIAMEAAGINYDGLERATTSYIKETEAQIKASVLPKKPEPVLVNRDPVLVQQMLRTVEEEPVVKEIHVVKEVPVEVVKEVVREVVKEVPVEVVKEIHVVKEVPVEQPASQKDVAERIYNDFNFFCSFINILYRPGMNQDFPNGGSGPFILNKAQSKIVAVLIENFIYKKIPTRSIILKSRQLGCTTLMLALELWLAYKYDNTHILFIIDKDDHFIAKREALCQWIADLNKRFSYLPKIVKKGSGILILSNGSKFFLESAMSPNPGTSEMIHILHESEKPKWPRGRAKQVKESFLPSLPHTPGTLHINESTAKGADIFYQEWRDAVKAKTSYLALFVPWFFSGEYYVEPKSFRFSTSDEHGDSEIDDDGNQTTISEQEYAERYSLSQGQILWRRIKINDMGGRVAFDQEYPTTPSHAFNIGGGSNFFSRRTIDSTPEPPMYIGEIFDSEKNDPTIPTLYTEYKPAVRKLRGGSLLIWSLPDKSKRYYIGGDVAEGKTVILEDGEEDPDYTVFSVKDGDGNTVAIYRARIKPEEAWLVLVLLAIYYNNAFVNCERNSVGGTLLSWFVKTSYPNNYVMPTPKGRPIVERLWLRINALERITILNKLRASYRKVKVRSSDLLEEISNFVYHPSTGKPEAARGYHDDIVLAEAHAEFCRLHYVGEEYIEPEEEVSEPEPVKLSGFTLEDTDFYEENY